MCTAINSLTGRHIFGRTLDLESSFGEEVVITPRRFPISFLHLPKSNKHLAIIGTARVEDGIPLYYDAANERGLCAAALNFPGFAEYGRMKRDVYNVASFELILWVLSRAENTEEARRLLANANITDESFSLALPTTPLHWIFADGRSAITAEPTVQGLKIHDNPMGVLTNSPDFSCQALNLEHYAQIMKNADTEVYPDLHSRGFEAFGLPGDFSSPSRFVRAAYANRRTSSASRSEDALSRFFHLMDTVSQPRGATKGRDGAPIATVYTSAIDTQSLEYCFTTYENRRIRCVKLNTDTTDGEILSRFSMKSKEDILYLQ